MWPNWQSSLIRVHNCRTRAAYRVWISGKKIDRAQVFVRNGHHPDPIYVPAVLGAVLRPNLKIPRKGCFFSFGLICRTPGKQKNRKKKDMHGVLQAIHTFCLCIVGTMGNQNKTMELFSTQKKLENHGVGWTLDLATGRIYSIDTLNMP